jgi:hypothetical protein
MVGYQRLLFLLMAAGSLLAACQKVVFTYTGPEDSVVLTESQELERIHACATVHAV